MYLRRSTDGGTYVRIRVVVPWRPHVCYENLDRYCLAAGNAIGSMPLSWTGTSARLLGAAGRSGG